MNLYSSSEKGDSINSHSAKPSSNDEAIGRLYDRLLQAETNKVVDQNLTIHKRLRFPKAMQEKGIFDSNDWLKANISLPNNAHILDAGCGVGGTVFALLGDKNTAVGITLSQTQVAVAKQAAKQLNVTSRCHFRQQSYDAPLGEAFDVIISIEALIHSSNLTASIQNLTKHLKPEGQLIILEDMALADISTHPLSHIWRKSWCLQTVYSEQDFTELLEKNGLTLIKKVDFTPYIQTINWPGWFINLAWRLLNSLSKQLTGPKDIFLGGWALEKLYRLRLVTYRLLIAKKQQ